RNHVPTELFDDPRDLPRGDSVDVHLDQRGHERLLASLVALEQARLKPAFPVLRNPQDQLADSRLERSRLEAVAPAPARRRPLEPPCANEPVELGLNRLLHQALDHRPQEVLRTVTGGLPSELANASVLAKGHRRSPGLWRA